MGYNKLYSLYCKCFLNIFTISELTLKYLPETLKEKTNIPDPGATDRFSLYFGSFKAVSMTVCSSKIETGFSK